MDTSFTVSAAQLARPLAIVAVVAGVVLAALMLRRAHLARIGLRNAWRRKAQTTLIVAGLMLSTMFVASALAVDDTITQAVRTVAVFNLGRIDEDVLGHGGPLGLYGASQGRRVAEGLRGDPQVAGVAPALAVPNVLAADETARQVRGGVTALAMDATDAGTLGDLRDSSGQPAPLDALQAADVYANASLATLLSARPGDTVTLYSTRWPGQRHRLRLRAIVSGGPLGDQPTAVLPLATLQSFAGAPGQINHIYVANAGDGLTGIAQSDAVADRMYELLTYGLRVDTVKQDGVQLSLRAQDVFGRILTLYTLFALAIGLLLIFLIFALLATERRAELGISRALGMRRGHIVRMLLFEGSIYDVAAAALGILAGLGLGVLIVALVGPTIARIGFPLKVEVQPASLAVAFCLGLVFTLATIWLAAWSVSRMTIAAAVRDLPEPPAAPASLAALARAVVLPRGRGMRQLPGAVAGLGALLVGLTTRGLVPIAAGWWLLRRGVDLNNLLQFSLGLTVLVAGVALALRWLSLCLVRAVALRRDAQSAPWVVARATSVADRLTCLALGGGLALYWSLPFDALQSVGFPRFSGGIEVFFVAGVMMVFGAVWALAPNLDLLLAPVRWLTTRIGGRRHVAQVALIYPSHHRFRTGVSIALFSLVCFTMVVMACIAASTTSGYDNLPQEAAGYDVAGQPLFAAVGGVSAIRSTLGKSPGGDGGVDAVSSATPLPLGVIQPGAPNARWSLYPASEVGGAFLDGVGLPLVARAAGYASDGDVWRAVRSTPGTVVIDAGALGPGDAAALGLNVPPAPPLEQFIGAPIAAGLPGLSSLESVRDPATATPKPLRGIQLNDDTLDQVRLRLQGVAIKPGEIRPTPVWVTDARGGRAIKLTVVGIVENTRGRRFGLFGSSSTFAPAERGLPPFGNEYYYFTVRPGTDAHATARALGSALLPYGFETTVLQDVLLDVNGPRVFISRVLVGLVGLTLLVGMASLAVTGTRAVVERRQQIGMLRALGYRRAHVQALFLIESLLIGAAGTTLGLVLGLLLCQNIFAVDFFEQFGTGLTLTVPWSELAVICGAALGVSLLAALLPAWQAGRVAPADALRFE